MPIPFIFKVFEDGIDSVPLLWTVLRIAPWIGAVSLLKLYFGGATNRSERVMHGKVVMVTGGTSGIGAEVVRDLALRGAQIILLTYYAADDPFLAEYIEDLRESTGNELIYAESVNLTSLHSIRRFATKWVDNAPPRRLDMILLFASTFNAWFSPAEETIDDLEGCWGLNYLANFHLLSILSPALRAQPPERDVRIVIATCGSYIGGDLKNMKASNNPLPKGLEYPTSKLALMVFAQAFQKHLDAYKRPDKMPMNSRVILVDPGYARTPGMRLWLSMGTLWGLLLYLIMWPLCWLVLKSSSQGAQSFLRAAMEADYGQGQGGRFIRECRDWKYARPEITDEKAQKQLWEYSEKQVTALEKDGAAKRALEEKGAEGGDGVDEKAASKVSSSSSGANTTANPARKTGSRRSKKAA